MSLKRGAIFLTITLVIVALGVGLGLGLRDGGDENAAATPTPAIPVAGVYINPSSQQAKAGEDVTINVEVNPLQNGVGAGTIHLEFDTDVLTVNSIEPGYFFGATPLVGFKQVEAEAGVIGYALARVGNTTVPTAPGIFAIIGFHVLETAKIGTSQLTLKYVSLIDENAERIKNVGVQDASIEIIPQ
jgi:hypothetical protein